MPEDKEQQSYEAKPILIDGVAEFLAETKIEDKWRLPDADGTIRLQIYNRGKIADMYDSLKDYLAAEGIILTPAIEYCKEHLIHPHRLMCEIGIPKGLEGVAISFEKQGCIFKRTVISINGDIPKDIAAHLKFAILAYASPNYRGYRIK